MSLKNNSSVLIGLISILFLSACAKTNYDGSPRIQPLANQQQQQTPPASTAPVPQNPPQPKTPPVSTGNLPVISFVESEVEMDGKLEAHLELQLSEKSNVPVVAVVNLLDGSARHYRDYAGFKNRSTTNGGGVSSEMSQTVVIPPGTLSVELPVIGGRRTRFCDTNFFAKISQAQLQKARVVDDTATINIPCIDDEPAPVEPPRVDPPVLEPVEARFEFNKIEVEENIKSINVKIILNRTSEVPVTLNLATQDGSAFANFDYVGFNTQLTIPAGAAGISVTLDLLTSPHCRTEFWQLIKRESEYDFNLVVTQINNATMAQPVAQVIVEKKITDDKGCINTPAGH